MFCNSCGKEIPDDSKFCEFCGSVQETEKKEPAKKVAAKKEEPKQVKKTPPVTVPKKQPSMPKNNLSKKVPRDEEVLSVGGFILTLIVLAIPLIGLIMLFVWGFGSTNKNRKNLCRALLILIIIGIVLSIFAGGFIMTMLDEIFKQFPYDGMGRY